VSAVRLVKRITGATSCAAATPALRGVRGGGFVDQLRLLALHARLRDRAENFTPQAKSGPGQVRQLTERNLSRDAMIPANRISQATAHCTT